MVHRCHRSILPGKQVKYVIRVEVDWSDKQTEVTSKLKWQANWSDKQTEVRIMIGEQKQAMRASRRDEDDQWPGLDSSYSLFSSP